MNDLSAQVSAAAAAGAAHIKADLGAGDTDHAVARFSNGEMIR